MSGNTTYTIGLCGCGGKAETVKVKAGDAIQVSENGGAVVGVKYDATFFSINPAGELTLNPTNCKVKVRKITSDEMPTEADQVLAVTTAGAVNIPVLPAGTVLTVINSANGDLRIKPVEGLTAVANEKFMHNAEGYLMNGAGSSATVIYDEGSVYLLGDFKQAEVL